MKSMITTTVLLVTLILTVTFNFFYINSITEQMEKMIFSMPEIGTEECVAAAREIQQYLESKEAVIGLSVCFATLDRACEQTVLLVSCSEARDVYGFQSARALLLDALDDMRRAEQFSIENLF